MPKTVTLERPSYKFTIPDKVRQFPSDPQSFSMRPITAGEERKANEIADGTKSPLAYELVRVSVDAVDGKPIDWGTSEPEWLERCSPKVRQLVFEAFARVNRPSDEDTKTFLDSQEIVAAG